jgi:hypothetical protein
MIIAQPLTNGCRNYCHRRAGITGPVLFGQSRIALIGATMYICAVGHILFISALDGLRRHPGVAVTFLMTGVVTNLPELISV